VTGQLTFPMARTSDPHTSHQAAARTDTRTTRALAWDALVAAGPDGLTDFELAARTGIGQTSIGKRRLDLLRDGMVEPVLTPLGKPATRPSPTGSPSIVWRAVTTPERTA
jgi:hypothetical protein